ncbi:hypothetical protein HanXRQr2_Chr12g0525221 [Helianthus annuus]|uniref:Uncharacterized protein n=1 Tax=Helianthus annuus TaxID=4232 RepID=A0A9K3EPN9_HELAN|nr:hypothetical protein HanXRQr2_Chr12g0525221 [Helianthus annuus]KAJ0861382.1 hypothetical protein HanPSC8_Chr12g0506011 [Helianthus annuus]
MEYTTTKTDSSAFEMIQYLCEKQRVRRNVAGVINAGRQHLKLRRRSKLSEIIQTRIRFGLNEQNSFTITINNNPTTLISSQPPSHRIKRHEHIRKRLFHNIRVEKVGRPVRPVEVNG